MAKNSEQLPNKTTLLDTDIFEVRDPLTGINYKTLSPVVKTYVSDDTDLTGTSTAEDLEVAGTLSGPTIDAINADISNVSYVKRRQCNIAGRKVAGMAVALDTSGTLVLTNTLGADGVNRPYQFTLADDDDLNIKFSKSTDNETIVDMVGKAAGDYQLYFDYNKGTDTLTADVQLQDGTNIKQCIYTDDIEALLTTMVALNNGQFAYDTTNSKFYVYNHSTTSFDRYYRLIVKAIVWDGAAFTSSYFYDYGAITKVDYTKWAGGNEYQFFNNIADRQHTATTGLMTFSELPINTIQFDAFCKFQSTGTAIAFDYAKNSTEAATWDIDTYGRWADAGSFNGLNQIFTFNTESNYIFVNSLSLDFVDDIYTMSFKVVE